MEADQTSGATTIIVPGGIFTLTILADMTGTADSGDRNLTAPLVGTPPITILDSGATITIIDGRQLDRVLSVAAGRTASLSGVTLRGGFHAGDSGGGSTTKAR